VYHVHLEFRGLSLTKASYLYNAGKKRERTEGHARTRLTRKINFFFAKNMVKELIIRFRQIGGGGGLLTAL
jgi:hypothetical protein